MNVSLTPDLERFVKEQVDTGRYPSESEVVRDGLRILAERLQLVGEINAKLAEAEDDVAAGRVLSAEQARAKAFEHLDNLARGQPK